MNQSDLLTIKEVATLLRVSPAVVRVWVAQRKLSSVNVGRLLRIRQSAVDLFMQRNERLAAAEEETVR